jgi:hypothetical protein
LQAESREEKIIASTMKKMGFKMKKENHDDLTVEEKNHLLQSMNSTSFKKAAEFYYSLFFANTHEGMDVNKDVDSVTQENKHATGESHQTNNRHNGDLQPPFVENEITRVKKEAKNMKSKDVKDAYDIRMLILGNEEFSKASSHQNIHSRTLVIPKVVPLSLIFPMIEEKTQEIIENRDESEIYSKFDSVFVDNSLAQLPISATEKEKYERMKDICSRFRQNFETLDPKLKKYSGYYFLHYLYSICGAVLNGSSKPEESSVHSFAQLALYHSGIVDNPKVFIESKYLMAAGFTIKTFNGLFNMNTILFAEPDFAVLRQVIVYGVLTFNRIIELATEVKAYKPDANFGQICIEAIVAAAVNGSFSRTNAIHIIPHISFHGPLVQLNLFAIPQKFIELMFTVAPELPKENFLSVIETCQPVCYTAELDSCDPTGYNFLLQGESQKAYDLLRVAKLITDMSDEEKMQLPIYKEAIRRNKLVEE